jgi:ankyrin repeat protein
MDVGREKTAMKPHNKACNILALGLVFSLYAVSACQAGGWKSHESPLIVAVKNNDMRQVKTLLTSGVKVDERDEFSERTALMRAAEIGNLEVVKQLLRYGADATLRDDEGLTALMIAGQSGNNGVVQALQSAEARARVSPAKSRVAKASLSGRKARN